MNISSGAAACWICLEEGPDEKGKPLIRDCACHGNDAGFAHKSCIIKCAAQKCKLATDSDGFVIPWEKCPNCNQNYQNHLAIHYQMRSFRVQRKTTDIQEIMLMIKVKSWRRFDFRFNRAEDVAQYHWGGKALCIQ